MSIHEPHPPSLSAQPKPLPAQPNLPACLDNSSPNETSPCPCPSPQASPRPLPPSPRNPPPAPPTPGQPSATALAPAASTARAQTGSFWPAGISNPGSTRFSPRTPISTARKGRIGTFLHARISPGMGHTWPALRAEASTHLPWRGARKQGLG